MEYSILNAIQNMHNPILDKFFVIITKLGDSGIIWILIAIVMILSKKYRKCGYMMLCVLLINLLIGEGILKHVIQRERPFMKYPFELIISPPITSSFPSGHTASSFAALGVFIFYVRKYIFPIATLAILISLSRIYLLVHYPSDVIFGAILGLLVSYMSVNVISNKVKYFEKGA